MYGAYDNVRGLLGVCFIDVFKRCRFVSARQKVFVETIEPFESALTHLLATGTSIRTKSTRAPLNQEFERRPDLGFMVARDT